MPIDNRGLLVVRPHPNGLDDLFSFEKLINQPMLEIDLARVGTFGIAEQFFVAGRTLIGILRQESKESDHVLLRPRSGDLLGVALRLPGKHQAIAHQSTSESHSPTGVLRPSRMESAIPGMDRRCRVS